MQENDENMEYEINEQEMNELMKVRVEKLKELQNKNKDPFHITKYIVDDDSKHIKDNVNDYLESEKVVNLAGRIMSKRDMGKASFCDIKDKSSKIQCYIKLDNIGEENYSEFKKYDIGDIIGVQGTIFATHMRRNFSKGY